MADLPDYCRSLQSSSTVRLDDSQAQILTLGTTGTSRPVHVLFGPLSLALCAEQAIELGNELIRAAHHWQAARAELVASIEAEQPAQAVQA